MRADDDVYIKPEKLEKFLRKLNSSEPIFLGQTGLGNEEVGYALHITLSFPFSLLNRRRFDVI